MIEAIFFDWDGTLMDDDASWRRCVAATTAPQPGATLTSTPPS